MQDITDLGDLALLAPLVAAAVILLWRGGQFPLVCRWAALVLACALTIAALKAALCGGLAPPFRTPSGHAGMSTIVYGGLGLMVGRSQRRVIQIAILLAAGTVILAIFYSRILLGYHTPPDAAAGLVIGLCFLIGFWWWIRRIATVKPDWRISGAILAALILIGATFHGVRLHATWIEACRF
jgi:membrane-associated phospholipid phosphatase